LKGVNDMAIQRDQLEMKPHVETDAQYDQRRGSEVLDALEKAYNEDHISCTFLLDVVKETIDFLKQKGY
tara:strand:+ start:353 stop:559 length:207 start_codon:yes stop_codon:yes gene_type:complete